MEHGNGDGNVTALKNRCTDTPNGTYRILSRLNAENNAAGGYIVIGRSDTLGVEENHKRARRNRVLGDLLQIVTYDEVVQRAKDMKQLLIGLSKDHTNQPS